MKKILFSLLSLSILFTLTGCGEDSDRALEVQAGYIKGGNNCGNTAREAPSICAVGKDIRIFHQGEELTDYNFLFSLGKIEEVGPNGEIISSHEVGSSDKGTYEPLFNAEGGIYESRYTAVAKKPSFVGQFLKK